MRDSTDLDLSGLPVAVTGATGFIGSRLALRLAELGAEVVGSGRREGTVPLLEGSSVRIQRGDIRDRAAMERLVAGRSVVFHVAAWLGADRPLPDPAFEVNVEATEQLVRVAAEAGVRRFVQVSSIAVYGPPPDGEVVESAPLDTSPSNDEYGRTKALGEQRARDAGEELGIEVAVVRPGMVYGPGSETWTLRLFEVVRQGLPVLFGAAEGHASPIYIDDLVSLLVLAGTKAEAAGGVFQAVERPVPWHEFFPYYGAMAGRPARRMPLWLASVLARANELLPLNLPLNRERLLHYVAKPVYPTGAAEQALGWRPEVPLEEGMRRAEAWLREAGHLT